MPTPSLARRQYSVLESGAVIESGVVAVGDPVAELVETIGFLRDYCPWTAALTHASLVEYLLEEAYEVVETIETSADSSELCAELGDVLLQVVLHARLAEERGSFNLDDVARGLTAKMIRRNPHIFRPDGSLQDSFPAGVEEISQKWDAVKKAEKPEREDPFHGIPDSLPALARAQKSLDRAERAGLTLPVVEPAETHGSPPVQPPDTEEALGDRLFAAVGAARRQGFDAERALRGATRRFQDSQGQRESSVT